MIERHLANLALSDEWGRQMRFIVGPRQSGKTTLARSFLERAGCGKLYYNWDDKMSQLRYRAHPHFFQEDVELLKKVKGTPWVCFDELHKQSKWKNRLKGWFDMYEKKIKFIVTGSAMLDQRRRTGDSLAGRFLVFHLYPFSLEEVLQKKWERQAPPADSLPFIEDRISRSCFAQESLKSLLSLSGFPEPFTKGREAFRLRWQEAYTERVIKEDIRDLTHIHDIANLVTLTRFLPETVGSPLSVNALREDLENVHFQTVKNYLSALVGTYIIFELSPYSKKIRRAVKKEKKIYFFDWTRVKNESARFENYVAFELFCWVQKWNNAGFGQFRLDYVRQATGKETDFLIVRDELPWLLVEVKLQDQPIASHHYLHMEWLGKIPLVQLCLDSGVKTKGQQKDFRVSASVFFS